MMTYQLDARKYIRGQQLTGETVVLSDRECAGFVESTLTNGTLTLAQTKGAAIISLGTLENCRVVAVKRQRDFDFFSARFIGCQFEGTYSGISFGSKGGGDALFDFGSVQGCDFTNATLDDCRFFNADVSTLRFPSWPHVVMLEPRNRLADAAAMDWPGLLGKYMTLEEPESVKAVVMHVPSLARLVKCTEEEIREAFEKFGLVK